MAKHEDYPTGSNNRGGPLLSDWLASQQVDGWVWDGANPDMTLDENGTPVLRYRFVRAKY